ncbi:MAG TPA: hypothetical protein VGF13_14430, partial [Verrucomicrobiae bacterium]
VKQESIEVLPQPPEKVMNCFLTLRADDHGLVTFAAERLKQRKIQIHRQIGAQDQILPVGQFAYVTDEQDFVEKYIRNKFVEALENPVRKRKLLDLIFGEKFRSRHSDWSKEIDTAFDSYSLATFDQFHATFNCIMSRMFYFYAPLCRVTGLHHEAMDGIIGRTFKKQRSNLVDEKYVQSALLCSRLLTGDKEMRNVAALFKANDLWNGQTVFIDLDKSKSLRTQIPHVLT